MKTITAFVIAAAIAATVPGAFAAEEHYDSHVSHHDAKFIRDAAEGNAMEIALAEVAVRKAQNPQVRDYAQRLIRDHEQANNQLQPLAIANGITWPVAITKSDAHTLDKYENMNGHDFDRSVMNHWVKDHREDIKEYDKAAKHAQDPQVKQYAISTLPTLRDHLSRAEAINSAGVVREPAGASYRESHHYNP